MKHIVFRQFFRDFCSAAIYPAVFLLSLSLLILLSAGCSREDEVRGGKVGSSDYITFTATGIGSSATTKSSGSSGAFASFGLGNASNAFGNALSVSSGASSEGYSSFEMGATEKTYQIYYDFAKGENVAPPAERFSDADGLSESSDTKFRGEVFTVGTGKYERIDWVDGDLITIAETYNSRKQFGDYVVSVKSGATPSITGSSVASLTPKSGSTPIQWVLNGSSDYRHDFLAIYPAVPSGATIEFMDAGYIEICDIPYSVFPSEQECTLSTRSISNERWYAPDMQYAYMTAYCQYTSTTPPSGGLSSPLLFTPGFNAVEVKLVKPQSLPASTTVKLVSAELLHGTGGATSAFSPGGNIAFNNPNKCDISVMGIHNTPHSLLPSGSSRSIFEVVAIQPGSNSNKITMTFSDGSSVVTPELDANVPTSFTFLAHPLPQKQLRLVLTLDIDGVIERRSIDLQTQSGSNKTWITVPIYQKLTISNVAQTWDDEEVTRSTPFTILTTKDNTNITINNINNLTFKYSIGGGALQTSNATPTITISVPKAGQKVRLYQESATALGRQYTFSQIIGFDQPCHVYGNIMSLCSPQTSFATATAIPNSYQFSYLFEGNANLRFHPTRKLLLPATTLTQGCYTNMFSGCTKITEIPEDLLPATTLAEECYYAMFAGCTGLTSIPANLLPATTLARRCYDSIFSGCTNLTSVPADLLPVTTLAYGCYSRIFIDCTGLTSIPKDLLPATTLAEECYYAMFAGCTGLTSIPADLLPATTLAARCYSAMFECCTGLTSIPADLLPTTTLAPYCYGIMFRECTGLTSLPDGFTLPATTLAEGCYQYMFENCLGLTSIPANLLPATTLVPRCYYQMFYGCSSLTKSPNLPATEAQTECYYQMFYDCSNLNEVYCNLTTNMDYRAGYSDPSLAYHSTYNWLEGVAATGTFYANPSALAGATTSGPTNTTWHIDSPNGIPVNWTRKNWEETIPLTIEPSTQSGATITINNPNGLTFKYSKDGGITKHTLSGTKITISANAGEQVSLYQNSAAEVGVVNGTIKFDKDCYVYGNVMSLASENNYPMLKEMSVTAQFHSLFQNNKNLRFHSMKKLMLPATTLTPSCYTNMFYGCTKITEIPDGFTLPATTLAEGCYSGMFSSTGLTSLPSGFTLPATTLARYCYGGMFSYTGLTSLPDGFRLPAETLAEQCYQGMFRSNSGLTSLPDGFRLPATTLANYCYQYMFENCSGLTSLPDGFRLPAETLAESCYDNMFYRCSKLTSLPDGFRLPAETLARSCYQGMFRSTGLTSLPDGFRLPVTTLEPLCYAAMFGSCRLASLPDGFRLPAETLAEQCYDNMFSGCSKLTSLPDGFILPATTLARSCYQRMFGETGLKSVPYDLLPATTLAPSCYSYMFYSCSSLTKSPNLPATEAKNQCYSYMFKNCTSLTEVSCNLSNMTALDCLYEWLYNVPNTTTGVFKRNTAVPDATWRSNGVPSNWSFGTYQ